MTRGAIRIILVHAAAAADDDDDEACKQRAQNEEGSLPNIFFGVRPCKYRIFVN